MLLFLLLEVGAMTAALLSFVIKLAPFLPLPVLMLWLVLSFFLRRKPMLIVIVMFLCVVDE